jgi:Glycosyl hydrolases family 31
VTLNVHPADGVRAHEDSYGNMAQALGHDPDAGLPIAFDPTDPQFLQAYLSQVHHPLEAEGVDFWWLDWQSGPISRMAGLDPLWLLDHLHFLDSGRDGGPLGRRPMTFSRYAGPGSHRYPVGFSGDTVVSWQSLAFQPEFTVTASNIGYGWWSHDVGGHMFGAKDDELATRWVQLGVFSPILRLHSTSDPFNSKEPWRFGEVARRVMTHYLRLRHRLLPYLATLAHHAHHDDRPLVEPMYHEYPYEEAAYAVPEQFRFGPALLVAPVTTPRDPLTGCSATTVWLPDGTWVDLLTGLAYRGGRTVVMHRDLDTLPLLARPGTVLPLLPDSSVEGLIDGGIERGIEDPAALARRVNDTDPPAAVELWVVAGADGAFTLVEDRDDDAWAHTDLEYRHNTGEVRVAPVRGAAASVPAVRAVTLLLIAFTRIDGVSRDGVPLEPRPGPTPGSWTVDAGSFETAVGVTVQVEGERRLAGNDVSTRVFSLLDGAQVAFATKAEIWRAVRTSPPAEAALAVQALRAGDALTAAVCEILLAAP